MTDDQIRIAVAEGEGFRRIGMIEGSPVLMGDLPPCRGWIEIPDYLNDLNAIHAATMAQPEPIRKAMRFYLYELCGQMSAHNADARTRSIALVKALGKWTE